MQSAISFLALNKAAAASCPAVCSEDGLPKLSSIKGSIASNAVLLSFVVAALSAYIILSPDFNNIIASGEYI